MSTEPSGEALPTNNVASCEKQLTWINDNGNDAERSLEPTNFHFGERLKAPEQNSLLCTIQNVNVSYPSESTHWGPKVFIKGPVKFFDDEKGNSTSITNDDCNNGTTGQSINLDDPCTYVKNFKVDINQTKKKRYKIFNKYLQIFLVYLFIETLIFLSYCIIYKNHLAYLNESNTYKLGKIGKNSTNFVPRNNWGSDKSCSVPCPLKRKSKIRLDIPKNVLFACTVMIGYDCHDEFQTDYELHRRSQSPFNDIYYNYIVGIQGNIYEARSLLCSYNEHFLLDDDHSETLVIGISYCFPKNSLANRLKTQNELEAINTLLNDLDKSDVLNKNLEFELPSICKNSLLSREINNKYNVKFYDVDYDISFKMNSKTIESILFQSYNTSSKNALHQINTSYFFETGMTCRPSASLHSVSTKTITVRLLFAEQLGINFPNKCGKPKECDALIFEKFKTHRYEINRFGINYFTSMSYPVYVFKLYPLNCSFNLKSNNIFITILINQPFPYSQPANYFQSVSELLLPITTEIKDYIDYNNVNVEFLCDKKSASDLYSWTFYEFISNVTYIDKDLKNINTQCANSPSYILSLIESKRDKHSLQQQKRKK